MWFTKYIEEWDWLRTAKYITAVLQIPATWAVFTRAFEQAGRSPELTIFNTLCAVLLMDVLLLYLLNTLEGTKVSTSNKLPYVIAILLLTAANLAIGYIDEGLLAFSPRVGLVTLVGIDVFVWVNDFRTLYFSRDVVEKRIRDNQVVARRKLKARMNMLARWRLLPMYLQQQLEIEKRLLVGSKTESPTVPEAVPAKPVKIHSINTLPDGVVDLGHGKYGWENPFNGATHEKTAVGKPYTMRGAQIARSRHITEQNNGH